MIRYIYAFTLVLLAPSFCFAQQSLVGTYKLVSLELVVDGQLTPSAIGPNPHGYLIVTPKLFLAVYTGTNRKFGTSVAEKAALWDTLTFVGGPYQLDGDRIIVSVDVSWNESFNGTKQTRMFKQDGNRLRVVTPPIPYPRDPSKTLVGTLVWERTE